MAAPSLIPEVSSGTSKRRQMAMSVKVSSLCSHFCMKA